MFDAELYRSKAEVEEWKKRDPIVTLIQHLRDQGVFQKTELDELERQVATEIEEAVNFAEAGTWEPAEDLTRFVYSERGRNEKL